MKKWVSLLCVCMMILGTITASVVSASAEDVEKKETIFNVKKGDEVTYVLKLDKASEPVVGTDFSIYYDSSVFELESVADYNDNTNPDEWIAVINPDLDGQVKGVWSILKGVDFSSLRNFITLNLKAKDNADDTHITYRIRFLYGNKAFDSQNPKPYLDNFEFYHDLIINGEKIDENEAPEWNDSEEPQNGKMPGGLPDGKSEHADPGLSGVIDKSKNKTNNAQQQNAGSNAAANNGAANGAANAANGGSGNGSAGSNGTGGGNAAGGNAAGGNGNGNGNNNADPKTTSAAPPATTAEGYYVLATDADGNVTATSDQAPAMSTTGNNKKGGSPVLWIIIALVVLAGGGAAVYFYMKKKPAANTAAPDAQAAPDSADTAEGVTADETAPEEEAPAQAEETQATGEDDTTQSADDASESDNQ